MYYLKESTKNSQKLLNFGKPKARFGSVLKAKTAAWLAFSEKKLGSAHLVKKLGSARQKVGSDPTLINNDIDVY